MKIKHLAMYSFALVACLSGQANAIEIDWDGSVGPGEHKYIPAISNPLFNETPYITTEVRPIIINQSVPNQNIGALGVSALSADVWLIAAEIRVALTDNLGIIATKDGYAWIDFDAPTNAAGIRDEDGFANLAFGLKYALWNNVENQSILSVGLKYEPPSGNLALDGPLPNALFGGDIDLNEGGSGFLNPFITGAKRFGKLGVQGSAGANIALDGDHDSSMIHYTLHADYELTDNIIPMVSLNGFTIYDSGNRTPFTFDGVDLVNLGGGTEEGTVLTAAGGIRLKVNDHLMFGGSFEKSIARSDLLDWRGYLDMVLHF